MFIVICIFFRVFSLYKSRERIRKEKKRRSERVSNSTFFFLRKRMCTMLEMLQNIECVNEYRIGESSTRTRSAIFITSLLLLLL